MSRVLRIVTWNIGGGFTVDHKGCPEKEDLQYFVQELLSLKPDVICLQELHIAPQSLTCPAVELLKRTLALEHDSIVPCDIKQNSHIDPRNLLGLAIISRYPQTKMDYLILPNPNLEFMMPNRTIWKSHDKALLRAVLQIGLSKIEIITGHAVPFHRFGEDFLDPRFKSIRTAIEDYILANPGDPAVFAGDLNYEDVDKLLPRVSKAGFFQALPPYPTEPHSNRRHDHILTSSKCSVLRSEIVTGHGDHCLCIAEIKI